MDVEKLLENAYVAYFRREWDQVNRLANEILTIKPLVPNVEAGARRLLAHSYIGLSINKNDVTKRSLRQSAASEAQKSITAYGRENDPDPIPLSESYTVLGLAKNLLAFVSDSMDEKIRLNKEAITLTEKALQINPGNREAEENLQKLHKTEAEYASAMQESGSTSSKTGCFIASAACGNPSAPEVVLLSSFRDDVLLNRRIGRACVRVYYVVSPPLAALITEFNWLRRAAMLIVVRPAVRVVRTCWLR